MDFSNVNIWAVLVSAVAAWGFGSLWYSPIMFGKKWQRELDYSDEYLKKGNLAVIFGGSFLLMVVMALGMSFLINLHGENTIDWLEGMIHGLYLAAFFVTMGTGINYLYQRKTIKLFIIDGFYLTAILMIMGAIIGAWR